MEKQANVGKAVAAFILGGAVGAGAALIMSKVCKTRRPAGQDGQGAAAGRQPGLYCDVPEGADICFPKD